MIVWLEAVGHEVIPFHDGKAFREGVREARCDLLILDWILPDTDGIRELQWVRKHFDWPIPVIFVTRMDKEEDVVTALEAGPTTT